MLEAPFVDLEGWTGFFSRHDIPVRRPTLDGLAALRPQEETVGASMLGDQIAADPLATVRLFAWLARRRSKRQITEITTIEGCIVMLGVPQFFAAFEGAPAIEDQLDGRPDALRGLLRVMRRARRASRIAWRLAVWRHDGDAAEIALAALLHDIAEILIWTAAPNLARTIQTMQRADPALRSRTAQKMVLNIDVHELQLALARQWQLPELFVMMMDHSQTRDPRVRTALLAVGIARHSAAGWDNPALPDDFRMIGDLLNVKPERVRDIVDPAHA